MTPTTSVLNLLRFGAKHVEIDRDNAREVYLPQPWLRDISLVDTPGTNAVLRAHEQITREFIPRSDLVLFVTSADRAFSESERQFLKAISEWSKKVVFVLNKCDLFETEAELEEVRQFVAKNIRELNGTRFVMLSFYTLSLSCMFFIVRRKMICCFFLKSAIEPLIFPVSTRLAARAKYALAAKTASSDDQHDVVDRDIAGDLSPLADDAQWQRSRFGALQQLRRSVQREQRCSYHQC